MVLLHFFDILQQTGSSKSPEAPLIVRFFKVIFFVSKFGFLSEPARRYIQI